MFIATNLLAAISQRRYAIKRSEEPAFLADKKKAGPSAAKQQRPQDDNSSITLDFLLWELKIQRQRPGDPVSKIRQPDQHM